MENITEIVERVRRDVSKIESYLWKGMEESVKNKDLSGNERSKRAIDRWRKIMKDVEDAITELGKLSTPYEEAHLIITINDELQMGSKILELNGETYPLKYWYEVLVKIANYILEVTNELPIINNFVHKREEDFTMSSKQLKHVNGYYIEVGDSKDRLIEKCKLLLEASNIGKFDLFKITKEGQKIKIN